MQTQKKDDNQYECISLYNKNRSMFLINLKGNKIFQINRSKKINKINLMKNVIFKYNLHIFYSNIFLLISYLFSSSRQQFIIYIQYFSSCQEGTWFASKTYPHSFVLTFILYMLFAHYTRLNIFLPFTFLLYLFAYLYFLAISYILLYPNLNSNLNTLFLFCAFLPPTHY